MAYSEITNAEIDQDSPITQTLMTKYRDNILATKGMVFLASSDASSSATLDFTQFDASLYDAYIFILSNVIPATNAARLQLRTSTNGGSTFDAGSSNYISDTNYSGSTASLTEVRLSSANGVGNAAGEFGYSGEVKILGPHLAADTGILTDGVYTNGAISAAVEATKVNAIRNAAEDVDAVRFFYSSGNIASGTITMYGMWNTA